MVRKTSVVQLLQEDRSTKLSQNKVDVKPGNKGKFKRCVLPMKLVGASADSHRQRAVPGGEMIKPVTLADW